MVAFAGDYLLPLGHATAFQITGVRPSDKIAAPAGCQRSDMQKYG